MPDAAPTPSTRPAAVPAQPVASHTRPARWLVGIRTPVRAGFVLYALILVTLTHWPGLGVPAVVKRPDLVVHFGAFGLWTVLLHLTGWIGALGTARSLRVGTLIAVAYALVDETSQGIPILRRVVAIDDAIANLGGVLLGTLAIITLRALIGPTPETTGRANATTASTSTEPAA